MEMAKALKSPTTIELDNDYYDASPVAGGRPRPSYVGQPSPSHGGKSTMHRSAKRGSLDVLGDRRFMHMDQSPDMGELSADIFQAIVRKSMLGIKNKPISTQELLMGFSTALINMKPTLSEDVPTFSP